MNPSEAALVGILGKPVNPTEALVARGLIAQLGVQRVAQGFLGSIEPGTFLRPLWVAKLVVDCVRFSV